MDTLGFIGLGNMGGGMANKLVSAGFDVLAFDTNREQAKSATSYGAKPAQNAAEIATACKTVILCLPHPDISRTVIFDELLSNDSVVETIIETSTLSPEIVAEFSHELGARSITFVSAPMVGGMSHAQSGTIEFLVEGEEKAFHNTREIFDAMGAKIRFMGAIPSATLAKLTFNLCRYANLAVAVEAARLLEAYGANKRSIHEFMSEQSLDNFGQVWAEDMKAMMEDGIPYKPSQVPAKDLALLGTMAESRKLDRELIVAIRQTYLSME